MVPSQPTASNHNETLLWAVHLAIWAHFWALLTSKYGQIVKALCPPPAGRAPPFCAQCLRAHIQAFNITCTYQTQTTCQVCNHACKSILAPGLHQACPGPRKPQCATSPTVRQGCPSQWVSSKLLTGATHNREQLCSSSFLPRAQCSLCVRLLLCKLHIDTTCGRAFWQGPTCALQLPFWL